ncbi:hypothetical protein [Planktotalea sp.]|uniref:hypothetical protein n=1 Tax=Planktotalea sp. TaxID=2029877 RepID=UPI00329845BB
MSNSAFIILTGAIFSFPICAVYFGLKGFWRSFVVWAILLLSVTCAMNIFMHAELNDPDFRLNRNWVDREDHALVVFVVFCAAVLSVACASAIYATSAYFRRKPK